MIGIVGGVAVGAIAGYVRARRQANKCSGQSCEAGPPLEFIAYPAIYAVGGGLVGGLIGWLWPWHQP
jgi:hypothetical protein